MARQRAILFGTVALLIAAISALVIYRDRGRAEDWRRHNLDGVLVFANPASCRTGEPLTRIVQALWERQGVEAKAGRPIAVSGFAEPLKPRLRRRYVHIPSTRGSVIYAELDIRGRWHGLKVRSLGESPDTGLEIRFAEPADRVRETLVRAGFPVTAVGDWRDADYAGPGLPPRMSIQKAPGGAIFYCHEALEL